MSFASLDPRGFVRVVNNVAISGAVVPLSLR